MTVKIRFQFQISVVVALIFSTLNITAQDTILNKHGLGVIEESKTLSSSVKTNDNKQMVDIEKKNPEIILDLRYSTTTNL